MQVEKKLEKIREDVSGIDLLAYIDLSSQIVLACDADQKPAQERLNGLAETANDIFFDHDAKRVKEILGWSSAISEVVISDQRGTSFWRISKVDETDAIFCGGIPSIEVTVLRRASQELENAIHNV